MKFVKFVLTRNCSSLVPQLFRGVTRLAPIVVVSLAIQSCGGGGGSNGSTATAAAATVPGAPTAVTATAGNASAVVSWTAASDGGSAITGYTVTANPGGATVIVRGGTTSATVSSLTDGTPYTFTVYASNAIGNGPTSTPSAVVTPTSGIAVPGAPTAVTATAGNASAVVSWTAPSNGGSAITGYTVTANPGGAAVSVGGGMTSATISGLANGTPCTFTVYATNAIGNGPASVPSAAVTPTTVPGMPAGVTATAGNASAVVSWTAPSDGGSAITGYTVTAGPGGAAVSVGGGTTSATVSGLTNGTPYTFTVYATNAIGNGPASTPSAAVTPATVPGTPTAVTAIAGNASAAVSWTASSSGGSAITGYTVTANPGGAAVSVGGGTTSATVPGLTNGTSYTFTVFATNAIGNGPVSAPSAAVTPYSSSATVPGAPTAVTATAGNASAAVSWTAPNNGGSAITGYTVTANPGGATVSVGGGTTSATVSGLTNGTSYTFTVYATNAIGNGPASTPSAAVIPTTGNTVPGAPSAVTATAGNASALVSWTAPGNGGSAITGYTVTANPGGAIVSVSGATTSATVSGLTNGTPYTFTVYATNAIGNGPASTPSTAVTPATVPGTPTGVTATSGNASAMVSWTAASNGGSAITGYTVTASPGGATASVGGGTTSATVSGLSNGTPYTFTVYATNAIGNGPASTPSAAVTPATVPGVPTGVMATTGNASAVVSWTAPSNDGSAITGYTVTVSPGGATASVAGGTTSATVSGLTNGTPYTFTVYATNAIGNGPASTPSAAVTPATVPGAPTGVTATAGNASALVSWTAPSNGGSAITGYTVTASPGGAAVSVGGVTTSATVSGLTNGTSYTFTVYATNTIGNGPTSAPSAPVTPSVGNVTIALGPARVALTTSQAQQFTAAVTGSTNTAVTWSVDGTTGGSATVGTVSLTGLYTPPSTAGTHTITATSQADTTKSASASIAVTDLAGVFTYHNDAARTGQNLQEYALNTTNVADPTAFGKLFSCAVDASVYAQPLYVANLPISVVGGSHNGTHNVVFVVTENDSVYAIDADGAIDPNTGGCLTYWYRSFLTVGVTPVPSTDTGGAADLPGTMGITGTPVIGNSTIYMVARFKTGVGQYSAQLRALNIATGSDIAGSPMSISPTVPGTAQGGSTVIFNPLTQSQRPALLLLNGIVYVAFGSAGDTNPFNGWLLGYDATTLAQTAVFNSTPNGGSNSRGAFWMCGAGPAADANGYIYLVSANGVFDNTSNVVPPVAPNNDMGDSLLKFNGALTLQDFFTPANQANDAATDTDYGLGGAVVLPDSMGNSAHPHLVVASTKGGELSLADRDSMGRYLTGAGGTDANVQTLNVGSALYRTPAVWGNTLYTTPTTLMAFPVSNAQIGAASSQTPEAYGHAGSPSISAQASTNGIVWILDNNANGASDGYGFGPAILRAYDATNLSNRLYSSDANAGDACGNAVKFTVPTIANGKVYVGGAAGTAAGQTGQLTVYGLKP